MMYYKTINFQVMKTLVILLSLLTNVGETDAQLKKVENKAFKKGEVLNYRLHYGSVEAGTATMEVRQENNKFAGRNVYKMVGTGTTNPVFDMFFKVRDRYETYIDAESLTPWVFIRRVDEGGYKINQNQIYNPYKKSVNSDGKEFAVPENVQDMLSAFYQARTIDYSNAKIGDIFTINAFVDNEIWPMKFKYLGKQIVKSDIGKIRCLKFAPIVQKGRVFKKEEDLSVWISDDGNKIPVRAEAKILVGSVRMDLMSYQNLANPVAYTK